MKVLYDEVHISIGETGIESATPGYLGVLAGGRGFYAMSGKEVVPLSAVGRCVVGSTGYFLTGEPESILVNTGRAATVLLRNECYTVLDNPPCIPINFVLETTTQPSRSSWLRMSTMHPRMVTLPEGLLWATKAGEPSVPRNIPFEVAVHGDMARFAVYDKKSFTLHCLDELEVSMLCAGSGMGRYTLSAIMASGSVCNEACSWSSSDESIAIVSCGIVQPLRNSYGTVIITASAGGVSSSCKVTVYATDPTEEECYSLPGGSWVTGVSGPGLVFACAQPAVANCMEVDMMYTPSVGTSTVRALETCGPVGVSQLVPMPASANTMLFQNQVLTSTSENTFSATVYNFNVGNCAGYKVRAKYRVVSTTPDHVTYNDSDYGSTGVSYLTAVSSQWETNKVRLVFSNGTTNKVVKAAGVVSSEVTAKLTADNSDLFYTPQNYILYRDRVAGGISRSSYVRIPNRGLLGSAYDLTCNNVPSSWFSADKVGLLCLDEAEVSMLCVDGTDGKAGVFQLHTVFTGGVECNTWVTWASSDPSIATVSSSGLVTAVSNGGAVLGKDVTITATYGGAVSSCLITVYQTMPSAEVEGQGLWLCRGGKGNSLTGASMQSYVALFSCGLAPGFQVTSSRIIHSTQLTSSYISHVVYSDLTDYLRSVLVPWQESMRRAAIRLHNTKSTYYDHFFGPVFTGGRQDVSYVPSSVLLNGATIAIPGGEYTSIYCGSDTVPTTESISYYTLHQHTKDILFSMGSSSVQSHGDLLDRTKVPLMYVKQNYVRYVDRTAGSVTRSNYTVVPNIGTNGGSHDLSANNVPATWFGV